MNKSIENIKITPTYYRLGLLLTGNTFIPASHV